MYRIIVYTFSGETLLARKLLFSPHLFNPLNTLAQKLLQFKNYAKLFKLLNKIMARKLLPQKLYHPLFYDWHENCRFKNHAKKLSHTVDFGATLLPYATSPMP